MTKNIYQYFKPKPKSEILKILVPETKNETENSLGEKESVKI